MAERRPDTGHSESAMPSPREAGRPHPDALLLFLSRCTPEENFGIILVIACSIGVTRHPRMDQKGELSPHGSRSGRGSRGDVGSRIPGQCGERRRTRGARAVQTRHCDAAAPHQLHLQRERRACGPRCSHQEGPQKQRGGRTILASPALLPRAPPPASAVGRSSAEGRRGRA